MSKPKYKKRPKCSKGVNELWTSCSSLVNKFLTFLTKKKIVQKRRLVYCSNQIFSKLWFSCSSCGEFISSTYFEKKCFKKISCDLAVAPAGNLSAQLTSSKNVSKRSSGSDGSFTARIKFSASCDLAVAPAENFSAQLTSRKKQSKR